MTFLCINCLWDMKSIVPPCFPPFSHSLLPMMGEAGIIFIIITHSSHVLLAWCHRDASFFFLLCVLYVLSQAVEPNDAAFTSRLMCCNYGLPCWVEGKRSWQAPSSNYTQDKTLFFLLDVGSCKMGCTSECFQVEFGSLGCRDLALSAGFEK